MSEIKIHFYFQTNAENIRVKLLLFSNTNETVGFENFYLKIDWKLKIRKLKIFECVLISSLCFKWVTFIAYWFIIHTIMLSLFPQLFDFAFPATAVLRLVVAIIFIIEGKRNFYKTPLLSTILNQKIVYAKKTHAILEIIGGCLLFIGLFVQTTSIILSLLILIRIYMEYKEKPTDKRIYSFYILLFFLTLSFLFLGPGAVSLDFPL